MLNMMCMNLAVLVLVLVCGQTWSRIALDRAPLGAVDFKAPTLDSAVSMISLQPIESKLTSVVAAEFVTAEKLVSGVLESEKSFFTSGVDRPIDKAVSGLESFANHLATSPEALAIGTQGEIFLAAANATATRLKLSIDALEQTTERESFISLPIQSFCPFSIPLDCSTASGSRYRTIDGSCNNVNHPYWGKAFTPFERFLPPLYDDMISKPRQTSVYGTPLPGAREISFTFHQPSNLAHLMNDVSHYSMEWGQFISHDIQRNALSKGYLGSNLDCCANTLFQRPGCFPIDIPTTDPFFYAMYGRTCMNFVRAVPTPSLDCSLGPRQQLNQNTHYLDASQAYGSDKTTSDSLRTFAGGRLKSASAPGVSNLLPKDVNNDANCILPAGNPNVKCFKTGDVRANQQPALLSLHTIFMREHNRIAAILSSKNQWNDQTLFDETRKIVGALIQHVTYNEYLPDILGNGIMTSHNLKPRTSGFFNGYSATTNGAIRNAFSTAAFRFGHSKVRDRMANPGGSSPNPLLKDVFLNPAGIYDVNSGVDGFTKGLIGNYAQKVDERVTTQLTQHLFERTPGFGGDLAAINIQRGRDHGIAFYKLWRHYCGNTSPLDHHLLAQLLSVYDNKEEDIDLFTAGVSELPVPGGKVGPVFACLIAKQFQFLKKGDRYFYENSGNQAFELGQLDEIRGTTMAKIICRNTGIATLQKNVFLKDISPSNPLVHCSTQSDIDFDEWQCAGWNAWRPYTQCFGGFKFRLRSCRTANPKPCVASLNPCPGSSFQLVFCGGGLINPFLLKQVESALNRQLSATPSLDSTIELDSVLQKAVQQGKKLVDSFVSVSKSFSTLSASPLRLHIP